MEKVKEMNKTIFRDNLLMTVDEVLGHMDVDKDNIRFEIIPVYEKNKTPGPYILSGIDMLCHASARLW